jgi:hypothetical protein
MIYRLKPELQRLAAEFEESRLTPPFEETI